MQRRQFLHAASAIALAGPTAAARPGQAGARGAGLDQQRRICRRLDGAGERLLQGRGPRREDPAGRAERAAAAGHGRLGRGGDRLRQLAALSRRDQSRQRFRAGRRHLPGVAARHPVAAGQADPQGSRHRRQEDPGAGPQRAHGDRRHARAQQPAQAMGVRAGRLLARAAARQGRRRLHRLRHQPGGHARSEDEHGARQGLLFHLVRFDGLSLSTPTWCS